jgi:hypothetical protein
MGARVRSVSCAYRDARAHTPIVVQRREIESRDHRAMPDLLYLVAVAGLSLSGLAAAIRLIEWIVRTDPRFVAQMGRWIGIGLAVLSAPLLLALLINEKWTAAMALAAMMLLAFAWYGPRLLQRYMRYRGVAEWGPPPEGNLTPGFDSRSAFDADVDDPELVRRSITVLERYLRRTTALPDRNLIRPRAIGMQHSGAGVSAPRNGNAQHQSSAPMSDAEALDILGIGSDASETEINEAHQRLRDMLSPERGGSDYLMAKVDQARSVLLDNVDEAPDPGASTPASEPRRRRLR